MKPRSAEEAGQIINKEAPIHHSNIMHYSKAKEVRSRVATKCVLLYMFCRDRSSLRFCALVEYAQCNCLLLISLSCNRAHHLMRIPDGCVLFRRVKDDGTKVRVLVKTGEEI